MKKVILVSLAGILTGGVFALFVFKNVNDEVNALIITKNEVFAFQTGVFSVYENAERVKKQHEGSYIHKDGDKYRVFIAIYQEPKIVNKMQEYCQDNNVDIYLKKLIVNDTFLKELNKYENLLKETEDISTYVNANKNILEVFSKTL